MEIKDMPYCPHCRGLVFYKPEDMVEIENGDDWIKVCPDCAEEIEADNHAGFCDWAHTMREDLEWN